MFKEIKGQDKPIELLKSYLRNGRLTGAYLFSGPEGTGKYAVAKILAQAVNCLDAADDACGRCASCVKIAGNAHPDVFIIDLSLYFDPESGRAVPPPQQQEAGGTTRGKKETVQGRDIKIDYIRALRDEINMRPYEGRKKVFIINDAHTLTRDAQDAFLKTLEEATPDSLIILISDKPSLLAKTIISRCRTLKFGSLPRNELEGILSSGYSLEGPGAAHYFAYFSEGRMGHAVRLAGKKGVLDEKNKVIDEFSRPAAGLTESALINKLEKAGREEVFETIKILAAWFRDLYVLKAGADRREIINLDRGEDLARLAAGYSFEELEGKLRYLSDSVFYLEHNLNVKLLLSTIRMELWKN
jgi:DNA polymerase-3 subunit delta'